MKDFNDITKAIAVGRNQEAIRLIENTPAEDRDFYAIMLARCYLDVGRSFDAEQTLNELNRTEESFEAYQILTNIYWSESRTDEAIGAARRALALYPGFRRRTNYMKIFDRLLILVARVNPFWNRKLRAAMVEALGHDPGGDDYQRQWVAWAEEITGEQGG